MLLTKHLFPEHLLVSVTLLSTDEQSFQNKYQAQSRARTSKLDVIKVRSGRGRWLKGGLTKLLQ